MTETVGPLLRAARENLGQTLDQVEAVLHIRARHLAALEADDYLALPSPAQARGFIKNYAQYLGLDLQDTLGLYEETLRRSPARPPAARPSAGTNPPAAVPLAGQPRSRGDLKATLRQNSHPNQVGVRSAGRPSGAPNPARAPAAAPVRPRRRLSADLLVGIAVSLVLIILLGWGGLQLVASLGPQPTPTLAGVIISTSAPSATATLPAEVAATAPLPTAAASYPGVNLTVRAEQRIWVSVTVDGQPSYTGLMPPGESREFIGQSVVEVLTGNGLGTRVIWNGQDQGVLGTLGQVVTRLWTLQGAADPTPAPTLEVTATVTVTP